MKLTSCSQVEISTVVRTTADEWFTVMDIVLAALCELNEELYYNLTGDNALKGCHVNLME
jgi:spore coat polysaccharide biosynthesis protein SpsF (cytidylyltransferase family)